jgi:hypothetical protein
MDAAAGLPAAAAAALPRSPYRLEMKYSFGEGDMTAFIMFR